MNSYLLQRKTEVLQQKYEVEDQMTIDREELVRKLESGDKEALESFARFYGLVYEGEEVTIIKGDPKKK